MKVSVRDTIDFQNTSGNIYTGCFKNATDHTIRLFRLKERKNDALQRINHGALQQYYSDALQFTHYINIEREIVVRPQVRLFDSSLPHGSA